MLTTLGHHLSAPMLHGLHLTKASLRMRIEGEVKEGMIKYERVPEREAVGLTDLAVVMIVLVKRQRLSPRKPDGMMLLK